jgi:SAM-dependent methyltransferase
MRKPIALTVILAAAALAACDPSPSKAAGENGFPAPRRPVADVVSATWGDHAERDRAGEVEQIVERLKLRPGMTVADIGAGDGYDSLRLAKVLGPAGKVVAEDITADYLKTLEASAKAQGLTNIQIVVGEAGDPKLPPGSIDAAIMVHMYHEIAQPFELLSRLAPAFKPGGLLGVEELDRPTQSHGTPPRVLTCELEAMGYRQVSLAPLKGDLGYFAVFAAPAVALSPSQDQVDRCN